MSRRHHLGSRFVFRCLGAIALAAVALSTTALPGLAAVPGPVQNVKWCAGSKDCLQWSATNNASQYRVYRGERTSLPCLLHEPLDSCLESIVVSNSTGSGSIPEIPAPGSFYWFIVTAESGTGEGPSGNSRVAGVTQPRFRDTFGSCPAVCAPAGGSCVAASDCCSSSCGGTCNAACCQAVGATCALPSDCCSNHCASSLCQPCLALGQSTANPGACCSGNASNGVCVPPCLPNGSGCQTGNQCCSGSCMNGSCQPCSPVGGSCTTSVDCCNGACSSNVCIGTCGDGTVAGFEACDDGNTTPGDGCSGSCSIEPGYTCSGSPSVCTPCPAGFFDCNGLGSDGCEVFISGDPDHCGACGNVCAFPNANAACNNGQCRIGSCNPNYADCNGLIADGCEVYLPGSPNHCGACGNVCAFPNANATCNNGQCRIGSCSSNYADCNGLIADGCEVYLPGSPNHCGACGNVCAFPNANAACNNGQCRIGSCNPNYADCNGLIADGCEVFLGNDVGNCGGCGLVCSFPNATPVCSSGQCQIGSCNPGFSDCDASASNGCETGTSSDPNNCGTCGAVCPPVANGTPTCSASICTPTCNSGFANCNGAYADGCEVNVNSSSTNCGACGNVCPPETSCSAGNCIAP